MTMKLLMYRIATMATILVAVVPSVVSAPNEIDGTADEEVNSKTRGGADPRVQSSPGSLRVAFKDTSEGNMMRAKVFSRDLMAPPSNICPKDTVGSGGNAKVAREIYVVNQAGIITVDGLTVDWNLNTGPDDLDFVSYIYNAGETDPSKSNFEIAGRLYLRWNCATHKLCALAVLDTGFCLAPNSDNWYKDYKWGTESIDALSPGIKPLSGANQGWEGCFTPPAYTPTDSPCRPVVEFHLDYTDCETLATKTGSPGRDDYIGLDLTCPPTPPTPPPTPRPSQQPSSSPSSSPSTSPSSAPSPSPSGAPSPSPSNEPSASPSDRPSHRPSRHPSASPSDRPSHRPSRHPTPRPSPAPTKICTDTAWAVYKVSEPQKNCISKITTSKWGWYIGPLTYPLPKAITTTTYSIYAGAGQCDPNKGIYTGDLKVTYDPYLMKISMKVKPPTGKGYYIGAHYYIGNDILPKKNGVYTAAPGQFDKTIVGDPTSFIYSESIPASNTTMYVALQLEWNHKC